MDETREQAGVDERLEVLFGGDDDFDLPEYGEAHEAPYFVSEAQERAEAAERRRKIEFEERRRQWQEDARRRREEAMRQMREEEAKWRKTLEELSERVRAHAREEESRRQREAAEKVAKQREEEAVRQQEEARRREEEDAKQRQEDSDRQVQESRPANEETSNLEQDEGTSSSNSELVKQYFELLESGTISMEEFVVMSSRLLDGTNNNIKSVSAVKTGPVGITRTTGAPGPGEWWRRTPVLVTFSWEGSKLKASISDEKGSREYPRVFRNAERKQVDVFYRDVANAIERELGRPVNYVRPSSNPSKSELRMGLVITAGILLGFLIVVVLGGACSRRTLSLLPQSSVSHTMPMGGIIPSEGIDSTAS